MTYNTGAITGKISDVWLPMGIKHMNAVKTSIYTDRFYIGIADFCAQENIKKN